MRIAIESQRLFRENKHGIEVVALELLRRLPDADTRHEYFVMVKEDKDKCLSSMKNMNVKTLKSAAYPLWEQWYLPKACGKINADVLHCTANTAPLKLKLPLILTLHDVIFLEQSYITSKASWYQRFGNTYRSIVVPLVAKNALRIITVSQYQKKIIAEKLFLPEEKIAVIHNGADERFFVTHTDEEIKSTLKKYKLFPGYIFFMANTEPRKNTVGVLKAYKILCDQNKDAPLLAIKGLNEEQLKKILAANNLSSVEKNIVLTGYIDYDDLPIIYQGASMLWFPSFNEGFGLPMVEAMAGGVAVITSNVSCMPEIAGDAALLINPQKPEEIADAAIKILSDSNLAKKLSNAGRERAKNFTWHAATEKLVAVYNEIEKII